MCERSLIGNLIQAGKVAIVRQLRPVVHFDNDEATLRALAPHLKRVMRIGKAQDEAKGEAGEALGRARFVDLEVLYTIGRLQEPGLS